MKVPVFPHTMAKLNALLQDEQEPLQTIATYIKYDPGLFFSFIESLNAPSSRQEVTTVSRAISLIGAERLQKNLAEQTMLLDDDQSMLLWCYAVLAGEAASLINERASIAEPEEAFFAAVIPAIGMLFMLSDHPGYRHILPLLVKIPLEDQLYLEERLFQTTHINEVDKRFAAPKGYKDIIGLVKHVRGPKDVKTGQQEAPSRLSTAYTSFQLYYLSTVVEYIAQALLFPSSVMSQENFRELAKLYFKIQESEIEELLTEIIERFEEVCHDFGIEQVAEEYLAEAQEYTTHSISFKTNSEPLKQSLEELYAAANAGKNVVLSGEAGVGKRLLAMAILSHPDNPRRAKPFLSFHCAATDMDTLEQELFGAQGGFWGTNQHKGAFEMINGGTILLKNIGRMSLSLQDRLADILTRVEYYRSRKIPSQYPDVVFIVTSRKDLNEEAAAGNFSKLLLRALQPMHFRIPPLRERREDIEFIANGIIVKYALPLYEDEIIRELRKYYATYPFEENLSDLKRLLFFTAAKLSLEA